MARNGEALRLFTMGTRRSFVEEHRAQIADLVRRHRGRSIAVFGSVARGEDDAGSDIDFLVEFEPGSSLFDLMHLQGVAIPRGVLVPQCGRRRGVAQAAAERTGV